MSLINNLFDTQLLYDEWKEVVALQNTERLVVGIAILVVILFTIADGFEDFQQGLGPISIMGDVIYMTAMLALLFYVWRFAPLALKESNLLLTREVVAKHQDLQKWQDRASDLLEGLGKMVGEQFDTWKLSEAEKQVGLLLLKGLSLKEIARIRDTSGQTVRQQAAAVYEKAGLSGRAELSAFFLEDLLLPPVEVAGAKDG